MTRHRATVVVAIKGLGVGGAERLISEGAKFWDTEAYDYHVVYALPWKDQLADEIKGLGFPVTCVGRKRGLTPATTWRLKRYLDKVKPDLVHAHLPMMGAAVRAVASAPIVYTEHNIMEAYRPASRTLNRLTYARNRRVIAVSDAVAASLAGFPGPKPTVIPNGVTVSVTPEQRAGIRAELGISDDTHLVVHVGNIRPGKGHDDLVEAVSTLVTRRTDVLVVSVGGEKFPGDLARLTDLVEQRGLSEHLRFLGRRNDATSFLSAADLVVNPSHVEGLPLVVLEAMALERPVLATAVGGVPSIIENGVTGVLADAGNPVRFAHDIDTLLDDPALRTRIAAAGHALATKTYGLKNMIATTEAVYREVLSG